MVDRIGQRLGNYRLGRLLGKGGFAEVYLGEHIHLGTQAAVKVLRAQLSQSDAEEFKREARTLAHLKNEHIVRVLDYGIDTDGETPYLVMDFAPKGTLRQLYQRGVSVPLPKIITYVKQVAAALYFAHSQNIVHRDVKPENMLLDDKDMLLLSDFGISIMLQSSKSADAQSVAGTAMYMAPEQIQGSPRPASDQYSLAVVVYEWLVGRPPFQGSFAEITSQHLLTSPPSLRSINPAIPAQVENVMMVALNKNPERRFASIQAFANALEQMYLVSQQPKMPPSGGAAQPGKVIRRLDAEPSPSSTPSQASPPAPPLSPPVQVGPSKTPAQPAFLPALPRASVSDFWWPTFFVPLEERKTIGSGVLPQERLGVSGNLHSSDSMLIPLPVSNKHSQPMTSSLVNMQASRRMGHSPVSTGQNPVIRPAGPSPAVKRSTRSPGSSPKWSPSVPPGQVQRTSSSQAAPIPAAVLKRAVWYAGISLTMACMCLLLIGLTYIPQIGKFAINWAPGINFISSITAFGFGVAGARRQLPAGKGKTIAGIGIALSVLAFLLVILWLIYYNSYLINLP